MFLWQKRGERAEEKEREREREGEEQKREEEKRSKENDHSFTGTCVSDFCPSFIPIPLSFFFSLISFPDLRDELTFFLFIVWFFFTFFPPFWKIISEADEERERERFFPHHGKRSSHASSACIHNLHP